jgi:putative ABC transport system permease protein
LLIAAYLLIKTVGKLRLGSQVTWRFGLANLVRRSESSTLQLVAFGMGMMALLLLAVVRVDLLAAWQHQFTVGTPNQFLVNILPEQVPAIEKTLNTAGLKTSGMYPMIVGKFASINGIELSADNYESERAKRFINRTFNFSSAAHLPNDNKILEGSFDPSQTQQLSVEETFAKELRIKLGDVLLFRVGGREVKVTVNSIRRVHWDSFNVNFFILGSPDMTQDLPATYVSSFYLPPERNNLLGELVRQYPNVTPVDIGNVLNQVQAMMQQAVLAVEYVFLFTLLAGIMVLYAALNASHEERLYEGAILRTLGATRRQILSGLLAEFITLGALAGFLAATVANVVGYLIGVHLFDLNYSVNYWVWLLGIFGGGLGVGFAGLLGTRRILAVPPLWVLRSVA